MCTSMQIHAYNGIAQSCILLLTVTVNCIPDCILSLLVSEGVVELWLTSEDTGAYGRDIGVTLPELLWQLVEVIPDGAMMRIGMTNPPYILEHLEVSWLQDRHEHVNKLGYSVCTCRYVCSLIFFFIQAVCMAKMAQNCT